MEALSAPRSVPVRFPFRKVHVGSLALCAIFLPWSTAFLSMAQMLLAANWLAEGIVLKDLKKRFVKAFSRPEVLVFLSFFGLHVLGLLWTEDMAWGTDLGRILFPILVFGVILGGSDNLTEGEFRGILLFGAWSVVTSAVVCYLFAADRPGDYRSLSMFISHIRMAMLLVLAIVVLLYFRTRSWWGQLAQWLAAAWALWFINTLGSIQGMLMLGVIAMIMTWRAIRMWPLPWRMLVRSLMIATPILLVLWIVQLWDERHGPPPQDLASTLEYTVGGERYVHDMASTQLENGRHVWTYLAWNEVERTWDRRQGRPLDSLDDRGHELFATLARYLTSKGLRKDSVGIMSLTEEEMRAIEQGVTNADVGSRPMLAERIHEVFFELDRYRATGDANGHSVTMRLEFLRAGWGIAKENWLYGVGTGDTRPAFAEQYDRMNSSLEPEWRLRAHNEYLTLWISFGVLGLAWSLFSWWWPAKRSGAWKDPLFIAWAIIFGISCLADDTVETQAGATFFALYYTLLVFAAPDLRNGRGGLPAA